MIHIAVLLKPYLDLIRSGEKTIECRLTKQARPPFDAISPGDRIYLKQSAGPYRLTAVCDHVLFEDRLSPQRIVELHRDYNEFICGDDEYWMQKRDAKYATLIWMGDVGEIDTGPGIKPLQGLGWLSIAGSDRADAKSPIASADQRTTRRRRTRPETPPLCFAVEITEGNLRNNSLYVTRVMERFPGWSIGGRSRAEAAEPITLLLRDGPRIETDIVGPRKLFRKRMWGEWFRAVNARPGDHVVFTPLDDSTYFVGLRPQP